MNKMEDEQNEIRQRPKWNKKMSKWETTEIEEDQNGRGPLNWI